MPANKQILLRDCGTLGFIMVVRYEKKDRFKDTITNLKSISGQNRYATNFRLKLILASFNRFINTKTEVKRAHTYVTAYNYLKSYVKYVKYVFCKKNAMYSRNVEITYSLIT